MKIGKSTKIWKEKPGIISTGPCWCCTYLNKGDCYLHVGDSFVSLLWEILTEYRSDKHLAGYGFGQVYGYKDVK